LTGLVIAAAIAVTLLCGAVLALAESNGSAVSARPTPTVYHIPTLLPSGQPAHPTSIPTIVIIPTALRITITAPASQAPTTTAAATATSTPRASQGACQPKPGWVVYRVQPGDTLFLIGLRYGLTVSSIMSANCLEQTVIKRGDVIYVPPVTPRSVADGAAGSGLPTDPPSTGTQTATDGACTDPGSVISSPKVGALLGGHVKIVGTARIPNFAFYKIEIRQEGTGQPYGNLYTGTQMVTNGVLAELDTSDFPNGEFWLRLVVVDLTSNYPERCAFLVTFKH
jgi:LysM repeat protein